MQTNTNESGQTTVEYALVIALVGFGFGLALMIIDGPFKSVVDSIVHAVAGTG